VNGDDDDDEPGKPVSHTQLVSQISDVTMTLMLRVSGHDGQKFLDTDCVTHTHRHTLLTSNELQSDH